MQGGVDELNTPLGAGSLDWDDFVVNVDARSLGWIEGGHGHALYADYREGWDWLNIDIGQKDASMGTIWRWYDGMFFGGTNSVAVRGINDQIEFQQGA